MAVASKVQSEKLDTEVPQGVAGADEKVHKNVYTATRAALMAQPKVRVRLREETFVSVNGVNFQLGSKEWLDVPEQVADILAEAGRI